MKTQNPNGSQAGAGNYYLYQGANQLGALDVTFPTSGPRVAGARFDVPPTSISEQYPESVSGSYVVQAGDTLSRIALATYGDAGLWYVIADANNLQRDSDLAPGLTLRLPNKILNVRNASDTVKPYKPGENIGDLTPDLPAVPPPPPSVA